MVICGRARLVDTILVAGLLEYALFIDITSPPTLLPIMKVITH
jgi:hypothetical protein